jgi:hypothetical protein
MESHCNLVVKEHKALAFLLYMTDTNLGERKKIKSWVKKLHNRTIT